MIISVASGKGGTGKTTIATSFALVLAEQQKVQYLDCDVEEPNGHILLKPRFLNKKAITAQVPEVNNSKCSFCGRCTEVCAYNALAVLPNCVLTFPELCHSCGGCWYFCPEKAIKPVHHEIGWIEEGWAEKVEFVHGCLKIGLAVSPPLIQAVKECRSPDAVVIIDAPPGTSCPVIKAVEGTDFCVLVTEPTPFGLHDLDLAVKMIKEMGIPGGVVVNRSDGKDEEVVKFCQEKDIPLLLRVPFDRKIAVGYAHGLSPLSVRPKLKNDFLNLWEKITIAKNNKQV